MLAVRGSTRAMRARLARLDRTMRAVRPEARDEVSELYLGGFAAQRSPDGAAWAPRARGGAAGYITGAMAAAQLTERGDTVRLRVRPRYGYYYHAGRGGQPARGLVPTSGAGRWEGPLRARMLAAMLRYVRQVMA